MAETIDDITIINRALARIGAAPIFSLDGDDDETRQVTAIFADLVEAAFTLWSWSWSFRTTALDKVAATPFGYRGLFRFPAGAMGPPVSLYASALTRGTPVRDFRVEGRTVAADTDTLWGRFPTRVDPADWPADFRLAFTTWLAASFAVPVTHDSDLAARLMQDAVGTPSEGGRGGLIGRAVANDRARSGGDAPLNVSDALTSAHRASGGNGNFGGDINGW